MEKFRKCMTEEILNLTLEIIYLLTGENYGPIKEEISEHSFGGCNSNWNPVIEPPPPYLTPQASNDKKIVEVTKKIIKLLTGEVPIRCQDVTVYFSMEEWEYLEGHKDLYKDVMMEDRPPFTSPASWSGGPNPIISPSSNCMNKDNSIHSDPSTAGCFLEKQRNNATSREEEEHVPYSDISTPTDIQDLSLPITEEHLSCEEHLPNSVISSSTHHKQSSSKEEALKAKEHLHISNIFTPDLNTQLPSSIKEDLRSAEGHLPHANISTPADHIPYISIQVIEEQQLLEVEHSPHISKVTHHGQEDSNLVAEHVTQTGMSLTTNPTQYSPVYEGFLSPEHVPHSEMSTPSDHLQYMSIQITEGPLSCEEEHLLHPEVSTLPQSNSIDIKDEPLSAVEPFSDMPTAAHHAQSTTPDVKDDPLSDAEHSPQIPTAAYNAQSTTPDVKDEPLSDVEHSPHISIAAHHAPSTTPDVKEEVLSCVEHLPHPSILKPTCYTQSTPPHVMTEDPSPPEHFPNPDSLRPTYAHSTPTHVKEEHPSNEEHLCLFDISTPISPTHSPCNRVKKEPLSGAQKHPSRCKTKATGSMKYTSTPIKVDSNPREKGSLTSIKNPSSTQSGKHSPRLSNPSPPLTHMNSRRFICGRCGRCYSIISNLELHMMSHTGDKLYKCWECGEMFSAGSLLADHYSRHAAEKEYVNTISARERAGEEASSSAHVKKCLSKDQEFICAMCGERFSSKYNLNVHTKRHTGVKSYSCPECGKAFTRKYSLNKHCRNYTMDKPPSCPKIGKTRHMIGHSGQKHYCGSNRRRFFLRETTLRKSIYPKLPSEEESGPTSEEKESRDHVSHETLSTTLL